MTSIPTNEHNLTQPIVGHHFKFLQHPDMTSVPVPSYKKNHKV